MEIYQFKRDLRTSKIKRNIRKPIEITEISLKHENLKKHLQFNADESKSMNQWNPTKSMQIEQNRREIHENQWKSIKIDGDLRKAMESIQVHKHL